jgi:hypothetical protein
MLEANPRPEFNAQNDGFMECLVLGGERTSRMHSAKSAKTQNGH